MQGEWRGRNAGLRGLLTAIGAGSEAIGPRVKQLGAVGALHHAGRWLKYARREDVRRPHTVTRTS
jgi:hypothetical protein